MIEVDIRKDKKMDSIKNEVDIMLEYNHYLNTVVKPVIEANEVTDFDVLSVIIAENDYEYPYKDAVIDLLTMGYIQKNEYDLLINKIEIYIKNKGDVGE